MKMIHSIVVPEILSEEEKGKRYQPLLDYLNAKTPNKLYRFRSCKERAIHEFDQDILGFASASEMNDDFDGMLYFDKERIKASLQDICEIVYSKDDIRVPLKDGTEIKA